MILTMSLEKTKWRRVLRKRKGMHNQNRRMKINRVMKKKRKKLKWKLRQPQNDIIF